MFWFGTSRFGFWSAYTDLRAMKSSAIERTLATKWLIIEDEQEVFTAMIALKEGRESFADALIGALGMRAGCSQTFTFDQKALRMRGFDLL